MDISTKKSASWKDLPWSLFEIKTFNLQRRIYSAVNKGDIKEAIKLQKFLINSASGQLLAVRKVTEFNLHNKIPGIDNKIILDSKEKFKILLEISNHIDTWNHSPLKKVKIPTCKTLENSLKIPTIQDRIIQYIWKLALEPTYNALFSNISYGSNSSNSNLKIQKTIIKTLSNLSKIDEVKVLKIDLSTSLEKIDYQNIIEKLIFPKKYKNGIFKALNQGILNKNVFYTPNTIQEISISPLLGCILLYGICPQNITQNFKNNKANSFKKLNWNLCYNTNLLFILKKSEDEKKIVSLIKRIRFKKTYMKIDKIELINPVKGFQFLDWNFVLKKNGRAISFPSRENWLIHKEKIKKTLKKPKYSIETRIEKLKVLSKDWYYYHRYCNLSKINTQLYHLKRWYSVYIRAKTKMTKEKRILSLKQIFHDSKYSPTKLNKNKSILNYKIKLNK
uniref:Group II intron protein n=1 Tax=Storeatula sp. CCMP1868 TaxID=195070 RepID=A0A222AHY4_9CRYP|nr:group II intron protein [Storeatula sp. CCMP1868]